MSIIFENLSNILAIMVGFITLLIIGNMIYRDDDNLEPAESAPKYIKFTFGRERLFSIIHCSLAVLLLFADLLSKILQWHNWKSLYYVSLLSSFVSLLISFAVLKKIKIFTKENQDRRGQKTSVALLLKIADLLPRKQRQILQQEALSMNEEYDEAILFGKKLRAKVIIVAYYFGLCWSVVMWISDKVKEVVRIIPKKN
jgi:FlaA1/EpsC-like NDP-sugar epimerase